jgi:inorganic triphosphatase YgiF
LGSEFELKYRATPEALEAVLGALRGEVEHFEMRTSYYDTPDRDLSARHWTLRRRLENETSVCTLKTPGDHGARGEFELECPCIETAIQELCKLSEQPELAAFAAKGLVEICGAAFHRRAITVALDGAVAEVALDQGLLLGGGKELPLCELEVELKAGDRDAVIAFAQDLAAGYHLEPEQKSKFRRAAELAGGI